MIALSTNELGNSITAFLQRFIGEQAQLIQTLSFELNQDMVCNFSEYLLSPNDPIIEEKAILNYYPIDTDNFYVVITYVTDQTVNTNHQVKIAQIIFNESYFHKYASLQLNSQKLFKSDKTIEQAFTIHAQSRDFVELLFQVEKEPSFFIGTLDLEIALLTLLKYALQGYSNSDEANSYPACSFLNNSQEREKIFLAKTIINNNLNNPLTIRALARECGINECYLKKGFKAMFGKTIHEYREYKRIQKSKELILNGNYNINEVAAEMGYTSHAYFSTAFKKIAGIKPCDLLA